MKNTVVIFNAGIGALTLGFQNAGYEILKAYEPDKKRQSSIRRILMEK